MAGRVTGRQIRDDSLTGDDVDESTLKVTFITDLDGDTKIHVEESADEDKIRFYIAGSEEVTIDSNGRLGINTNDPNYKLDVSGNMGINEFIYHNGDEDTHIRLQNDQIDIVAGGQSIAFDPSNGLSVSGSIMPSVDSTYDIGSTSNAWLSGNFKNLNVTNQIVVSSDVSNQELIRLQKNDSDSRYLVFENNGEDSFEMYLNSFENFVFTTTNTTDDIVFKLNGHSAIYMNGYPKEVSIWENYNSAYNTKINSTLEVKSTATTRSILPESHNTYTIGASDGSNSFAGVYANEVAANSIEVFNTLTLSGSDISFQDNAGTFPTDSGGFFWDLNDDEARIYAKQPSSDAIDFVFKLSDNNHSQDRYIFWIDDYRGGSYDKYPLVMHGTGVFFQSPESSEGVPDIGNSKARFDSNGRLAFNCQNQTDPSLLLNHAHIYSKLDSGTAEMFVRDSDGNVTKISPHNTEGEWEYFSRNTETGKVVRINMEKMIRKLEEITGESFMEEWYEK